VKNIKTGNYEEMNVIASSVIKEGQASLSRDRKLKLDGPTNIWTYQRSP
jgi:hypothetical protein